MDEEISPAALTNNLKNVKNTVETSQFIDISLENMPETLKNGIMMNFVHGMSLKVSNDPSVGKS